MGRRKDERTGFLFNVGDPVATEPLINRPRTPVWTEHKARLIERYLYYFVLVTKHGAYIDGFAGPQEELDETDGWSAKLVMESEPRWLQKLFLFDAKPAQVQRLRDLEQAQAPMPKGSRRRIEVHEGDFNRLLPGFLGQRPIKDKEASFALLDQRTFECQWESVEALARYKPAGHHKIELFYFLPNHWLDRAIAATKDEERLQTWWGRDNWDVLRKTRGPARAQLVADRFRGELGYASAKPWPIMQRDKCGGSVMYFMIHAADHPESPKLMDRAYRRVLRPKEHNIEQLTLEEFLEQTADDPDSTEGEGGEEEEE